MVNRRLTVDVFIALKAAIKASNGEQFKELNYVAEKRKGEVI